VDSRKNGGVGECPEPRPRATSLSITSLGHDGTRLPSNIMCDDGNRMEVWEYRIREAFRGPSSFRLLSAHLVKISREHLRSERTTSK
jgi:hypothetical protein